VVGQIFVIDESIPPSLTILLYWTCYISSMLWNPVSIPKGESSHTMLHLLKGQPFMLHVVLGIVVFPYIVFFLFFFGRLSVVSLP
jgi:hypothetical protein